MRISIIIPVYNTDKTFLDQCVHSILNQSVTDVEVLIVDDGSENVCATQCDSYAEHDNRVKVFHIRNCGVAKARNFGIDHAEGEWIAFADSDDWFENDAFSVIGDNLDSDIDMLIFDSYRRTGDLTEHNHYFESETIFEGDDKDKLQLQALWKYVCDGYYPKYNTVGTPWGKIIRADIIKNAKLHFPENMKIREDMIFILYAIQNSGNIKYIRNELYNYRIHSESAMNIKRSPEEEYEIRHRISSEVRTFNKTFNKAGLFEAAYNIHLLNEAMAVCRLYHGDKSKLASRLREEPYITAIKKADVKYLDSMTKLKKSFLVHENYNMLYLMERSIDIAKKIKHLIK
ncbi:MAG: glycosyltransferase family 2 protein [Oscillospiraceae bacterium]|nr:glycosyltransferase family 2 protein [Oscillospiraceae bacterium]